MDKRTEELLNNPILPLLVRMSAPNTLAFFIQAIVVLTEVWFISKLGTASLAAVALGAKIIEKHYTFDRNMDGLDHNFSLVPSEFTDLVNSTRRIELSLLDHGYGILPSEIKTAQDLRRSLFFRVDIKKGERVTQDNIEIKSPGIGIHPKYLPLIINRKVSCDVECDYPIQWDLIE